MKCLAWDTSSKQGALAAFDTTENQVFPFELDVTATHSEKLLWAADQLLEQVSWDLHELEAIGVGTGPGSFTGLRIGLTTARTLAHTLDIPLIPFSSLYSLVVATDREASTFWVGAMDAFQGEVYATYCEDGDWVEKALRPKDLASIILEKLDLDPGLRWAMIGDGLTRYPEAWKVLPPERNSLITSQLGPSPEGVAMATRNAAMHDGMKPALTVYPRYFRASTAEEKLKRR